MDVINALLDLISIFIVQVFAIPFMFNMSLGSFLAGAAIFSLLFRVVMVVLRKSPNESRRG